MPCFDVWCWWCLSAGHWVYILRLHLLLLEQPVHLCHSGLSLLLFPGPLWSFLLLLSWGHPGSHLALEVNFCHCVSHFHTLSLISQQHSIFFASQLAFNFSVPKLITSIAVYRRTSRYCCCLTFLHGSSATLSFEVTTFPPIKTFQSVTFSLLNQWFSRHHHHFG